MGNTAQQAAMLIDMLPEDDQQLAFELVKKLVLAWDPDYTKLTLKEAEALDEAEKNLANGEYFTDDEIDWN